MAPRRGPADDDDDESRCCVCGVDPSKKASNLTKRTLLTNVSREHRCGHRFCNGCVERGVAKKGAFPCPVAGCGATVRRATLDARTMEDIEVERDALHRKRVLAVFNAPASSFGTPREYDDYLETVEDAIYTLTRGGPEAEAVEKRLAAENAVHADAVASRAAAQIAREREARADVVDGKQRAEDAAAKLRSKRTQEKKASAAAKDHAQAYALGDRADAPRAKPRVDTLVAAALPAPIGRPQNPRRVTGAEAEKRAKAGGYDAGMHARREDMELFYNCDRALILDPPPPAHVTPFFADLPRDPPKPKMPVAAMDIG